MTITLPTMSRNTAYSLRPVRSSETQRAGTGGTLTPLNRPGDHWAVEVDVGAMDTACGRTLLADIVRGMGERIRIPLPQPGINTGSPGLPKVNGADQAGSSLIMDGFTAGYVIAKGRFMTVVTPDGPTAHIVTAAVTASGGGAATVSFWPDLWLPPADNDVVEIAAPYIEGLIVDDGGQLSGLLGIVTSDAFVVEEG